MRTSITGDDPRPAPSTAATSLCKPPGTTCLLICNNSLGKHHLVSHRKGSSLRGRSCPWQCHHHTNQGRGLLSDTYKCLSADISSSSGNHPDHEKALDRRGRPLRRRLASPLSQGTTSSPSPHKAASPSKPSPTKHTTQALFPATRQPAIQLTGNATRHLEDGQTCSHGQDPPCPSASDAQPATQLPVLEAAPPSTSPQDLPGGQRDRAQLEHEPQPQLPRRHQLVPVVRLPGSKPSKT